MLILHDILNNSCFTYTSYHMLFQSAERAVNAKAFYILTFFRKVHVASNSNLGTL